MGVKKSIFGSSGEAHGFHSIEQTWGDRYSLFSNIPFSVLFEPEPEWQDTSNFFFKTSIDYVLCTQGGQPLLAVEFDGLGGGFGKGRQYVQAKETTDPHRKLKFDFKLRYAEKYGFPYHVVASPEFDQIDQDVALTVVDGIIGHELAERDFDQNIDSALKQRFHELQQYEELLEHEGLADLSPEQRRDFIESTISGEEARAQLENNPFAKVIASIRWKIMALSGGEWNSKVSFGGFLPPGYVRNSITGYATRGDSSDGVNWIGFKVTVHHEQFGEVTGSALIRCVAHSEMLVKDIAELLAYNKLLHLLSERLPQA